MNDEAWRQALIAYWTSEHCLESADRLRRGEPMDYLDRRAIASMKAAFERAPVAA